jgi:hypothetical protein
MIVGSGYFWILRAGQGDAPAWLKAEIANKYQCDGSPFSRAVPQPAFAQEGFGAAAFARFA